MKLILLENTSQELSNNTIFIDFRQVSQKVLQYKCNLNNFWYGLLPNMVISRDSG